MKTILIADDDEMFRSLTSRHLRSFGLEVIETADGQEVEGLIAKHNPVAAIIDIVMPSVGGMTVLTDIRSEHKKSPLFIAVSANKRFLDVVQAEHLGDAYLQKPIRPETLKQTLLALEILPT